MGIRVLAGVYYLAKCDQKLDPATVARCTGTNRRDVLEFAVVNRKLASLELFSTIDIEDRIVASPLLMHIGDMGTFKDCLCTMSVPGLAKKVEADGRKTKKDAVLQLPAAQVDRRPARSLVVSKTVAASAIERRLECLIQIAKLSDSCKSALRDWIAKNKDFQIASGIMPEAIRSLTKQLKTEERADPPRIPVELSQYALRTLKRGQYIWAVLALAVYAKNDVASKS